MHILPRSAFLLALFGDPPAPVGSGTPSRSIIIMDCGSPIPLLIEAEIQRHTALLGHCYTQARSRIPALEGSLSVQFSIRKGEADRAHLRQDGVGDPALAACVLDVFRWMRFPIEDRDSTRSLVVNYPIRFVHEERARKDTTQDDVP